MKVRGFVFALTVAAPLALLAGCSESRPTGVPGSMLPSRITIAPVERTGSWIDAKAKTGDLIYVSNGGTSRNVTVYSWPSTKLVGTLTGFSSPRGLCVDKAQDIYTIDSRSRTSRIDEYAHGGTSPIKTLNDRHVDANYCSVDPTTGNLAVAYYREGVFIYAGASGIPTRYKNSAFRGYATLGYDDKGNLFVDGSTAAEAPVFAELAKGSGKLRSIKLDKSIVILGVLQWDGKYLAVADDGQTPNVIYQFSVSHFTGTVKGSTILKGTTQESLSQFWVENFGSGKARAQGTRVLGTDYSASYVGDWKYPTGGTAIKTITDGLSSPVGVTVSNGTKEP